MTKSSRHTYWLTLGLCAVTLHIGACGGESATPAEPEATPAPAPAPAPSGGVDLSGPEFQGDHSLPGDADAGQAIYTQHCLACHGADGTGNGGITGGDFVHDQRRLAKNNETLLGEIRDGIPGPPAMPPWGTTLSEQEMRDVLSYIRRSFTPPDAPWAADTPT